MVPIKYHHESRPKNSYCNNLGCGTVFLCYLVQYSVDGKRWWILTIFLFSSSCLCVLLVRLCLTFQVVKNQVFFPLCPMLQAMLALYATTTAAASGNTSSSSWTGPSPLHILLISTGFFVLVLFSTSPTFTRISNKATCLYSVLHAPSGWHWLIFLICNRHLSHSSQYFWASREFSSHLNVFGI